MILILTKNYVLFLSIKIIVRLVENIILAGIADKKYPYIKKAGKLALDKHTRGDIISNTKALSLHYIGSYLINGTDYIIISSAFWGVVISGILFQLLFDYYDINDSTEPVYNGCTCKLWEHAE